MHLVCEPVHDYTDLLQAQATKYSGMTGQAQYYEYRLSKV